MAQVDTTTSLHPGSYGSSLRLENVTLTSRKFRVVLSPSLVSKGAERERSEVGRTRQAGWQPGHGRSIASPGRRWRRLGIGTIFRAGGSRRCVQTESVVIYDI